MVLILPNDACIAGGCVGVWCVVVGAFGDVFLHPLANGFGRIETVFAAEWITHPNHRHQQSGSTMLNGFHTHQHRSCNQRIC